MAQDDGFIREVNEELRREQLKQLWQRYGIYIVGACVAIVAAVAGWRAYETWEQSRAQTAGAEFQRILDLSAQGSHEAASNALAELETQSQGGYRLLTRFRRAAELARNGDRAAATQVFDALANDQSLQPHERDLARIRGAYLRIDADDPQAIIARVEGLTGADNVWRHSAREIIGLAYFRAGDDQQAYQWLRQANDDAQVPTGIRSRINVILLILASRGVPGADSPSAPPSASSDSADPTSTGQ